MTSFHLTRHLTGDGVASCYHGGALLHARGPEEALRVLLPAIQDAVNSSPPAQHSPSSTSKQPAHGSGEHTGSYTGTRALAASILSSVARYEEAKNVYHSILRDKPGSRFALLGMANCFPSKAMDSSRTSSSWQRPSNCCRP